MFDFDAGKLLIVGIIALIFIPPKDLPRVLRQVGQFVGRMKRMAGEFQGQFMDAMREADMADLRREAQKLSDSVKVDVGLGSVNDFHSSVRRDLETPTPGASAPAAPMPAASMPALSTQESEPPVASVAPPDAAQPARSVPRLEPDDRPTPVPHSA